MKNLRLVMVALPIASYLISTVAVLDFVAEQLNSFVAVPLIVIYSLFACTAFASEAERHLWAWTQARNSRRPS